MGPPDQDQRWAWLVDEREVRSELEAEPPWVERFAPWGMQEKARDTEGDERYRWLDRCIAAFDAIVDAPRDPGNDEGPFHAVARWMDLGQVHRALAVVERMAPHPWPYRMGGSRAALTARLAALGELDAAWAQLERFDRSDGFWGHWTAVAKGGWAAFATHLPVVERLERVAVAEMSDDERWLVFREASRQGPVHDRAEEWLEACAALVDPELRSLAVRYLAADRWEALPPSVWIRAVQAESQAAMALLELVDEGGVACLRAAETELRRVPEPDAFAELLGHPTSDPWVLEACGWAWLEGRPGRYDLDPAPLLHWMQRRGG